MPTREITLGSRTMSIETGKLAKQADGAVIVRSGDTMVIVTACHAANAARRHRLPAADGRLPRIHLRVGPHPRRLLQARRQARREGSADEPPDRSARSGRSSRPAGTTRRRSSRCSISADTENDSDVLAITGASAALALSSIPFQKTIAGVRVGLDRRRLRHQPDLRRAQDEQDRPGRRRQRRTRS